MTRPPVPARDAEPVPGSLPLAPSLPGLHAQAQRLLAVIVACYTAEGAPLPTRRYVNSGAVMPWDCEQMTVGVVGVGTARTPVADPTRRCDTRRDVTLRVEVVREHGGLHAEGGTATTEDVAERQRAAAVVHADLDLIDRALRQHTRVYAGPAAPVVLDVGFVAGPAGYYVSARQDVTFPLGLL